MNHSVHRGWPKIKICPSREVKDFFFCNFILINCNEPESLNESHNHLS